VFRSCGISSNGFNPDMTRTRIANVGGCKILIKLVHNRLWSVSIWLRKTRGVVHGHAWADVTNTDAVWCLYTVWVMTTRACGKTKLMNIVWCLRDSLIRRMFCRSWKSYDGNLKNCFKNVTVLVQRSIGLSRTSHFVFWNNRYYLFRLVEGAGSINDSDPSTFGFFCIFKMQE